MSSNMWIIHCENEYSGEWFNIEGLFSDERLARNICGDLNACAEASKEEDNNLHEMFHGIYRIKKAQVSKTGTQWREEHWWGRKYMDGIDNHPTVRALENNNPPHGGKPGV